MKSLLLGILFIIIVGIGGLAYRNAVEHPLQPIACPMDAQVCPDGTAVSRTGNSCTFPACPPPNVSLTDVGISFAIPAGFAAAELPDDSSVAAYDIPHASSTETSSIIIRRFTISASSTALATIQQTAIGGASGLPAPTTAFTSTTLGTHRFTVVSLERFEGVVDTAYYLAHGNDVLRFDAIDRGTDWTNPNLDVAKLTAHAALVKLLTTLQGQ
ncbi:MAG: hypothetical protein PHV99_01305 [Candidatus Pacebacteria bacterium]|nr:hypothetical protein [Candidatus Paceibacterota bacterium]